MIKSMLFLNLVTAVLAIHCDDPETLWEKHYCNVQTQPAKFQQLCLPNKISPNGTINGLIMIYHGFTGCPDEFKDIANDLARDGYVVITPLLPGHGIKLGYGCDKPNVCVARETNPSFLPTTNEEYANWVDWSLDMIKEETSLIPKESKAKGFFIGSIGLSLGGLLGTMALSRPDTPFSRFLTVNPFYSFSYSPLDLQVQYCKGVADQGRCALSFYVSEPSVSNSTLTLDDSLTVKLFQKVSSGFDMVFDKLLIYIAVDTLKTLIQPLKDYVVQNTVGLYIANYYSSVMFKYWWMLDTIAESPMLKKYLAQSPAGWGRICDEISDRGGYCNFRVVHLLLLHNLASHALGHIDKIPTSVQYSVIHTDYDGPVRDSISATLLSDLQVRGVTTSKCRYPLRCKIQDIDYTNNVCGMPHSSFSRASGIHAKPHELYWEKDLFENIHWFFKGNAIGKFTSGKKDGSACIPTNTTIGYGEPFDQMGIDYVQNIKTRFK